MKNKRNLRVSIALLLLMITIMLVGCGTKENIETTPDPAATATPVLTAAPDEPVQAPVQNQGSASERFTCVMGTTFVVPEGFIQLNENPGIG